MGPFRLSLFCKQLISLLDRPHKTIFLIPSMGYYKDLAITFIMLEDSEKADCVPNVFHPKIKGKTPVGRLILWFGKWFIVNCGTICCRSPGIKVRVIRFFMKVEYVTKNKAWGLETIEWHLLQWIDAFQLQLPLEHLDNMSVHAYRLNSCYDMLFRMLFDAQN